MDNTSIRLTVKDRIGLVSEVMKVLSDMDVMVYQHKADVFQDNLKHIQVATLRLTFEPLPQDRLTLLLKRLNRIKGFLSVDVL